jgi:hypothetical protein
MHASVRRVLALAVVGVSLSVFVAYAQGRRAATARTTGRGLAERQPAGLETDARPPEEPAIAPADASSGRGADACGAGMQLVDGAYCTAPIEDCLEWQDPPQHPFARCARFAPSRCAGPRVHKRFCIDRDEFAAPGEALPENDVSWTQAKRTCEGEGKRLCLESEWEFACEGEQMFPYPTGYERDGDACNFDKEDLLDPATGRLRDLRRPVAELDRCVSPFGARAMSGNVDEWVWRDRTPGDYRSALKGGWWMPARDRCRPATTAHGENFAGMQTGFRCCADARP